MVFTNFLTCLMKLLEEATTRNYLATRSDTYQLSLTNIFKTWNMIPAHYG